MPVKIILFNLYILIVVKILVSPHEFWFSSPPGYMLFVFALELILSNDTRKSYMLLLGGRFMEPVCNSPFFFQFTGNGIAGLYGNKI